MGAHGGLRESKVVCLKNMVGPQDVDETLQVSNQHKIEKSGSFWLKSAKNLIKILQPINYWSDPLVI